MTAKAHLRRCGCRFLSSISRPAQPVRLTAPNGISWSQPTGLFINHNFVKSTGPTIISVDPATEQIITQVQAASAADVNSAVIAARKAFVPWRRLHASQRGILIGKLADLMESQKEILATIEAWDNGKPYHEALAGDLEEAISVMRYYSGWSDKIHGQTISFPQKLAYTLRQPVGVVGQVIPWNYPLSMATWKLGPALACGNTVVLKAAEQTPLSILKLGELFQEAGFPPGVVNLINGDGPEAGSALVSHPLVDKVAFTGSTATARKVMAQASKTLKNVTFETGGKSPLIVFADCNLDQAVKWAHLGIMSNQGQICTATSRILVEKSIYKEFVASFAEKVRQTSKVGHQWDPDTYQGPQVSKAQYERVLSYIETGRSEATLAYGGDKVRVGNGNGFFVSPTVFTDMSTDARIWREEIFGPVVCIRSFDSEEEAVRVANDSDYGLGSAVFTQNIEKAHRIASDLDSGMVWINSSQDSDPRVPFGGVKQSGVGRELGEAALEAYTQKKAVHINLGNDL